MSHPWHPIRSLSPISWRPKIQRLLSNPHPVALEKQLLSNPHVEAEERQVPLPLPPNPQPMAVQSQLSHQWQPTSHLRIILNPLHQARSQPSYPRSSPLDDLPLPRSLAATHVSPIFARNMFEKPKTLERSSSHLLFPLRWLLKAFVQPSRR